MGRKVIVAVMLAVALMFASCSAVISAFAASDNQGPPDIQQRIFIHYEKGRQPPMPPDAEAAKAGATGYYKLIGAKWKTFPVPLEVNPSNPSGLTTDFVLTAIGTAAEEWDSGAYSQSEGIAWYGVTPDLFADTIGKTDKGYNDLAWTSDKMDGKNTIVWGNYPTSGVIAVTILWYNRATKTILEFDIVFDTDYTWGDATTTANVMDLQNIATHELGHGAGLDDVYNAVAYRETMYGYSALGEIIKRDLYIGDKAGITKLYG
jgi:hypothetical protein